jgi:hypothetical protein
MPGTFACLRKDAEDKNYEIGSGEQLDLKLHGMAGYHRYILIIEVVLPHLLWLLGVLQFSADSGK